MALKIALLTVLMLCGCATTATSPGISRNAKNAVVVHVENYNWDSAVVYIMRGSSKIRLGSVHTGQRRELSVPWSYVARGDIQLFVRFVGARNTLTTEPVPVRPGQHVNFVIRNYLPFSVIIPRWFQPDGASYHRMESLQPLQQAFSSQVQRGRTNV